MKLNEWLSVGATLNINKGNFNLKMPAGLADLGEGTVDLGQYEENMNGWGFGATFGVLAKPVDKLGIGLTVRTPSTVSFKGSARMSYLSLYGLADTSDLTRKITWPLWIAGGVSFRPVERLLLSADVHWTQWSKLDRITTEYLDSVWAALMEASGNDVRTLLLEGQGPDPVRGGIHAERLDGPAGRLLQRSRSGTLTRRSTCSCPAIPTTPSPSASARRSATSSSTSAWSTWRARTGSTESGLNTGRDYGMRIVVPSVSVSYKF